VGVVVLKKAVKLDEYPVLAPEGFLSDLKAEGAIQDDIFVNVGYGLLEGFPPSRLRPTTRAAGSPHPRTGTDAEQPAPPGQHQRDWSRRDVLR
jgi:hypothetical protein